MKPAMPEPDIGTRNGKPGSVIIPIENYEELLERVEDAGDLAWLKRARRKPLHYRPLEEYLREPSPGLSAEGYSQGKSPKTVGGLSK